MSDLTSAFADGVLYDELERLRAEVHEANAAALRLITERDREYERLTAERDAALAAISSDGADAVGALVVCRATVERLRVLLREARTRTQNLLNRQHGDAIIMNPDAYLRATLSLLDAALADQPNGHS